MKLNINGEEIELKYSFRSNIYFEQISNKNVEFTNFTANDLLTLFYSVVIASLQKAKKPIITMLDFMDVIDDNGGDKCLLEFSNWYSDTIKTQYEVVDSMTNEEPQEKEVKSKKKN